MRNEDGSVTKLRRAFDVPGHAHELTFSCHQKRKLLGSDRSRQWFLDALEFARKKHDFELWAYVIMPDHAHLLLLPRQDEYSISAILKSIKQSVARRAIAHIRANNPDWLENLKVTWPSGRVEYRFWQQGGGYDRNMMKVRTIWNSISYLHENPVRKKLVAFATDWPWSSARWYKGLPDCLLIPDRPLTD